MFIRAMWRRVEGLYIAVSDGRATSRCALVVRARLQSRFDEDLLLGIYCDNSRVGVFSKGTLL